MKTLIYLLFLLPAGASVYSQSARPAYPPVPTMPPTPQGLPPSSQSLLTTPHLFPLQSPGNPLLPGNQGNPFLPTPQLDFTPGSPNPQIDLLLSPNPIRTLQPDNMPCLVPNLGHVERMPVRRMTNTDRMPNGFGKKRSE